MKPLGLRLPKSFDYTEAETLPVRTRYYCIAEGPTEESYFEGIRNNRKRLGIKNDVYIEVIPKKEGQESFSHPQQLTEGALRLMGRIDADGNDIPEPEWERRSEWEGYDPQIDHVCVIFDADYRGLEILLPDIIDRCLAHGIEVVMSSPNFELWLLMHYPEIQKCEKELLHTNPKNLRYSYFSDASKDKKYLEIVLSKCADGYKKGEKLDFEKYIGRIHLAMEQSKFFCEELDGLLSQPGTMVGKLLRQIFETE